MSQLFIEPKARAFTNTGAVGEGFKYYFYTTGTTTPITTYSDSALSVANANPVVADANGRFGEIWISSLSTTKVVLTDADDVTIETVDPVGSTSSTTSLNDLDVRPTSYWGLTTGSSTAYVLAANPSISAYSNVQTFYFQPHTASGVAATMAVSELTALALKKYTGQGTKVALQAGDLQATERYHAVNDGVDIIVLNPRSPAIYSGVPEALTIATGTVSITNSGSSYVLDTEGAAASDDLDTINGGNDGEIIYLRIAADARVVNVTAAGNILPLGGATMQLNAANIIAELRYDAALALWVMVTNNLFTASKAAPGYTYLPNGLLFQWGTESVGPNATDTVNLPITYTTSHLSAQCSFKGTNNAIGEVAVVETFSTSQIKVTNGHSVTTSIFWYSLGY
tara:strand:- start:5298 stop:6488 length:1191 start_codon:yes stop_codon:yes gene_type:complete